MRTCHVRKEPPLPKSPLHVTDDSSPTLLCRFPSPCSFPSPTPSGPLTSSPITNCAPSSLLLENALSVAMVARQRSGHHRRLRMGGPCDRRSRTLIPIAPNGHSKAGSVPKQSAKFRWKLLESCWMRPFNTHARVVRCILSVRKHTT